MASDSIFVRPEALLRHRDFVVGLARGLVADVPKDSPVRRARWVERGAPEDELCAGLALQQKVVQAVLDLAEPYRTIVLLRYYARLSIPQVAERRGDSELAVRAQLERAIDLLRGDLDLSWEGGRDAWAAGLLALSRKARALALLARSAALAAVLAGVAIPVWLAWKSPRGTPGRAADMPGFVVGSGGVQALSLDSLRASLASRTIPELVQVAVQTQRTLRGRLLEPSEDLRASRSKLLAMPSTGLARILHRGKLGKDEVNALGLKGAGSSFSFATGEPAYDDEADLVLEERHFISIGEGPGVLDLGLLRLEDLPGTRDPVPPTLGAAQKKAWRVFWDVALDAEKRVKPAYRESVRALELGPAVPLAGHTYLVRGLQPGRHDVLAAFEAIAEDEYGWTIAWRLLAIAPSNARPEPGEDPHWWVPPAPAWHAETGVEPLVEMLGETRAAAGKLLFEPPRELRSRFASMLAVPGTKLARILSGDRYAPAVSRPGGGSRFSFADGLHVAERRSDVRLDGTEYTTRLEHGACGILLDCGLRAIETIEEAPLDPPDGLSLADREVWELLWNLKPLDQGAAARAIARIDETRVLQFAPVRSMPTHVGHTYLLRSIVAGDHDVLAAFAVLDRDEHGDWVAWKRIRSRDLREESKRR